MVICFSAVSAHTGHLHAWFVTHKILSAGQPFLSLIILSLSFFVIIDVCQVRGTAYGHQDQTAYHME